MPVPHAPKPVQVYNRPEGFTIPRCDGMSGRTHSAGRSSSNACLATGDVSMAPGMAKNALPSGAAADRHSGMMHSVNRNCSQYASGWMVGPRGVALSDDDLS